MNNITVKAMVTSALGMALVFLATYLIKIPNGIQGYFNMGDGFIMMFGAILNPFMAFLVGGVGSALADIAGGYAIYAIFTLFIKGIEGCIIAWAFMHIKGKLAYASFGIGALFMVLGYLLTDTFVNESWILGLSGIPGNIVQGVVGILIALLALPIVKRSIKR